MQRPRVNAKIKTVQRVSRGDDTETGVIRDIHGNRAALASSAGDLDEEAEQFAEQHGLALDLARKVVARKLRLPSALSIQNARLRSEAETQQQSTPRKARSNGAVVFLLVLAAIFLGLLWANRDTPAEPVQQITDRSAGAVKSEEEEAVSASIASAARPPDDAGVTRDEYGGVIRVVGPSPEQVLRDYCRFSLRCRSGSSLELAQSIDGTPGTRFGLFRSATDPPALRVITLYRNPVERTWVAGDGRTPIPAQPADRVRLAPDRLPAGAVE